MNTTIRTRTAAGFAAALTIAASFSLAGSASAPRFYQDDPVWVEHDTENAAGLTPYDVCSSLKDRSPSRGAPWRAARPCAAAQPGPGRHAIPARSRWRHSAAR